MPPGKQSQLFLIPIPLSDSDIDWSIPLLVKDQILKIQSFIVENSKTSRHFLKQLNPGIDWSKIQIFELDKHRLNDQNKEILSILGNSESVGLMSEAGLPCIADPGNHVVRIAHENGIRVRPLTGPSSVLLALISSGMDGQNFRFNGYLASKPEERRINIIRLEQAVREGTQLFIEAPYRNDAMFKDLLATLKPETRLLLAIDISGAGENIICRKVSWWKSNPISIGKIPCLFAIGR